MVFFSYKEYGKIHNKKKNMYTNLCDDDWSSRFVIGSKRNVAGALYGPTPAEFAAATLTVYVTPSVKLANRSVGVAASIDTFVNILDLFKAISTPRTTIWYVVKIPGKLKKKRSWVNFRGEKIYIYSSSNRKRKWI